MLQQLDEAGSESRDDQKEQDDGGAAAAAAVNAVDWAFLSTQQRFLDANTEIRARFGSAAVRGADSEERKSAHRGAARRASGSAAGGAVRQRLVRVGDDWPPVVDRGDMRMVRVNASPAASLPAASSGSRSLGTVASASSSSTPSSPPRGWLLTSASCPLYSFSYSADYERLQQQYLAAVATHDVSALLFFSQQHPYHVDCALQLAEVAESQGEFITAHLSVQRALHMLELAMHRDFPLFSGRARLDPESQPSRSCCLTLARHAQMLGKKGCSRTALEVCKLLLSLSPLLDPQCVLLFIDYHAIRSQQLHWLLALPPLIDAAVVRSLQQQHAQQPWPALQQLVSQQQSGQEQAEQAAAASSAANSPAAPRPPASLLPNLCYACALAAYLLEEKDGRGHLASPLPPSISPPALLCLTPSASASSSSFAPSAVAASAPAASSSLLHQAVLLFPEVVDSLVKASGLWEREQGSAEWRRLAARLSSLYPQSAYVDKLVLVYAERSGGLWKTEQRLSWLRATAEHVVATLDRQTQPLSAFHAVRAAAFPRSAAVPPAIRSLQRSAFTDAVSRLPPELLLAQAQAQAEDDAAMRAADGHLPIDRMSLAALRAALDAHGMQALDLNDGHPLLALLRSLLPWNVAAPQVAAAAQQQQQQQQQQDDLLQPADEGHVDDVGERFIAEDWDDGEADVEDLGEH